MATGTDTDEAQAREVEDGVLAMQAEIERLRRAIRDIDSLLAGLADSFRLLNRTNEANAVEAVRRLVPALQ